MSGPDLTCDEPGLSGLDSPHASVDLSLLQDRRVLDNMLRLQSTMLPTDEYLYSPSSDIKPAMRKVVTNWMLEVCDEQRCEDQVFLVAVNLLDRFLNTTAVKRSQLQLSACVCLLLASKLRQCSYLSVELLAYYTDNCVTSQEVIQWEILVVAKLKWDLCPVTAIDFVEVILQQIPVPVDVTGVRRHASTFIALAATESEFICQRPSCVAGAAIVAAIQGLTHASRSDLEKCIEIIANMLKSRSEIIKPLLFALEASVKRASSPSDGSVFGNSPTGATSAKHQEQYSKLRAMMDQSEEMVDTDGKETPVDILDVPNW
ncbi:G1/S-specific cyclin-D3 [Hyalella azteca]|uniref:G1/S-specific cyclin-D3 n=1 Tax=Hyalella azteca TaxID=294128 RepID=A0A8B7NT98_HYAAZ|nr:G1/S-specific cyclin-D3 [Hyalella azteca]